MVQCHRGLSSSKLLHILSIATEFYLFLDVPSYKIVRHFLDLLQFALLCTTGKAREVTK